MFRGPGRNGLSVHAGQHGAIRVIEHLGRCRTKQHAPKKSGVRGHDDEIEAVSGSVRDLRGGISGGEDSRALRCWKFAGEERIEPLPGDVLMLFCNLGSSSQVKLKAV